MREKYLKLQNGSDIRGVSLTGVPGEPLSLREEEAKEIAIGFIIWLSDKLGKRPEDMTLEAKGKPVPGGTVTVKETLVPKQAGNKNVEWTLDVGEDIATVAKGKVKIAKTAPAGTVITVTCTALGAPEPVVRTVQIEVAEK